MKKVFILTIIIGGLALVSGSAIILVNRFEPHSSGFITNEHVLVDNFENFDIDLTTANLEFKKAEDGQNRVVCRERDDQIHLITIDENTLTIRENDMRAWYEKISLWYGEEPSVTIYLNHDIYRSIKANVDMGSIKINDGFTFDSIELIEDTGDINIEAKVLGTISIKSITGSTSIKNTEATSIYVKNSTGNVLCENVKVDEMIKIEQSTGNVYIKDSHATDLEVHGRTGSISFIRALASNRIKVTNSTGSVKFDHADAASINVKTSTGSVSGSFLTSKIFYTYSSSGHVNVPLSTSGGLCRVETTTGNINLTIL